MGANDEADRFDAARAKCPTTDELRLMSEAAWCEAMSLDMRKPHAHWSQEASAWSRLAEAAHVCEALLVRRHLSFVGGVPPQKGTT
jgi:hypothetical protein